MKNTAILRVDVALAYDEATVSQISENDPTLDEALEFIEACIPAFYAQEGVSDFTEGEWRQRPASDSLIKALKYHCLPCCNGITQGEALDLLEKFDRLRDDSMSGDIMSLGLVQDGVIDGVKFEQEFISLSVPEEKDQGYSDEGTQIEGQCSQDRFIIAQGGFDHE